MATQLKEPDVPVDTQVNDNLTQTPANDAPRDWEGEARQLGWKPEAEFGEGERRPATFKDAETFVRDGEEKAGLQKETIAHLKQRLSTMERSIKKLTAAEQAAYQRGMDDLKAQMREAVAAGDQEAFDKLDQQREKLIEKTKAEPTQDQAMEAYEAFRDNNDWYDKGALASATADEAKARIFADRVANRMAREGRDREMAPEDFFAEVERLTHAQFPSLKAQPQRQKPRSDVAGVSPPGSANGKGAASLPPEAKEQARRFFERGIIKAKSLAEAQEKYAKDYFAQG